MFLTFNDENKRVNCIIIHKCYFYQNYPRLEEVISKEFFFHNFFAFTSHSRLHCYRLTAPIRISFVAEFPGAPFKNKKNKILSDFGIFIEALSNCF